MSAIQVRALDHADSLASIEVLMGISGQLLERVVAAAEADPTSSGVVLETGNPNNLAFYGRYDFEVVGRAQVEILDLHVLFRPCREGVKA